MQRENKPSLLPSFHTEIKQESLDPDCDISGAQCSLVDSEMISVKLEDCSQTLGLNIIKYEEEEEEIGVIIKDEEEEEEKEEKIAGSTNQDVVAEVDTIPSSEGTGCPLTNTPIGSHHSCVSVQALRCQVLWSSGCLVLSRAVLRFLHTSCPDVQETDAT
ncbi:hypothetical protein DPEC_G00135750 [Dallia pectoralis]|uniref:Uncharacterized protein n=1 Tax=Dallia pectoralis TaxID=75939 RepID=A0ACC2GLF1_DALPE|nr:hypothetical protein DPEC_G00135750 [Dallia pectoralis]